MGRIMEKCTFKYHSLLPGPPKKWKEPCAVVSQAMLLWLVLRNVSWHDPWNVCRVALNSRGCCLYVVMLLPMYIDLLVRYAFPFMISLTIDITCMYTDVFIKMNVLSVRSWWLIEPPKLQKTHLVNLCHSVLKLFSMASTGSPFSTGLHQLAQQCAARTNAAALWWCAHSGVGTTVSRWNTDRSTMREPPKLGLWPL